MKADRDIYKDVLFGVATGDALGVPVEFEERKTLAKNPVLDMKGYGTYNLPPGTWSDDSSLTFCLAEALTMEFSLQKIANNFVAWLYENYWTPRGVVFDIGIATRKAILRLAKGERPDLAGGFDISDNGNGSLMRILPLVFYLKDKTIEDRYAITKQVSSLTHAHVRSVMACFYYLEFARLLLKGENKFQIYNTLKSEVSLYFNVLKINTEEVSIFDRLLVGDIFELSKDQIRSSGYVIHTLEASIWCLITSNSFEETVLKAINLGEDTDTTGAVAGGLAGLLYGYESIPEVWRFQLARFDDIENLASRLADQFRENTETRTSS